MTIKDPLRLELEESETYSQYFLYSQTEIMFILRDAMQKNCMVTVYFDMGRSFFLSSLLGVSPQGIFLDYGNHEATNLHALSATHLICTLSLDKVKVQFALSGLARAEFEGKPAFRSRLPETLLRLQRREHFRIPMPTVNPLVCRIFLPDPGKVSRLPLLDLSVGGLGLKVLSEQIKPFSYDALLEECTLVLPEAEPVSFGLGVRTVLEITPHAGRPYFRVGCEFVGYPRSLPILIQRYITTLERERKARLSGLE
ncbi:MAG: flagellar brake protein [Zoogloeaceae bacterium]|jgi:c-di-GMP-binding flagellar brake protein YcgR|nr:flagellar brake protein [Zoogloeaceae bacterium]